MATAFMLWHSYWFVNKQEKERTMTNLTDGGCISDGGHCTPIDGQIADGGAISTIEETL